MSVKIGDKSLVTTKPNDLDEQLVATTGCNAAELAAQLNGGTPLAGTVAAALHPFLKDGPSVAELASDIAAAGVMDVQSQVAALYAQAPAGDGLTNLTIPQLRSLATDEGIDLGSLSLKADIVGAIHDARTAKTGTANG